MSESTQHKLDRVRPPRVQITYYVEIGGAIQLKELPFVVGILADLADQQDALPSTSHGNAPVQSKDYCEEYETDPLGEAHFARTPSAMRWVESQRVKTAAPEVLR